MPNIQDLKINRKRTFEKKEYRPWNNDIKENINPSVYSEEDGVFLEVDPKIVKNWQFHDRSEEELGDIGGLAKEFLEIGQLSPCVVRRSSDSNFEYELIAGERRWRAAKIANVKLKVVVREISDKDSVIIQAKENLSRKGISDFSRGMNYSKLLKKGIITSAELIERLDCSKQYLSSLLSFSKIKKEIADSIGSFVLVSSKTAEAIVQLSNKGIEYEAAIISNADLIKSGRIGHNKLRKLVENIVNANESPQGDSSQDEDFRIKVKNNTIEIVFSEERFLSLKSKETKSIVEILDDICKKYIEENFSPPGGTKIIP